MMNDEKFLEQVWQDILSREVPRISTRFTSLDAVSRAVVVAHLKKMANEHGWHPEQVLSARAALQALNLQEDDA